VTRPIKDYPAGTMPVTKATRAPRGALPITFRPKFWEGADRRAAVVREVERRVELFKGDCGGGDSVQRRTLCERAAFITILLETAEVLAIDEKKPFDSGAYTQQTNTLLGLLKALGLEKRVAARGLKAYVAGA
jgi:hypothetical protein